MYFERVQLEFLYTNTILSQKPLPFTFVQQIRVRRVFDKVANNIIYTSFSTRLDKGADANNGRYKSSMCAIHINL